MLSDPLGGGLVWRRSPYMQSARRIEYWVYSAAAPCRGILIDPGYKQLSGCVINAALRWIGASGLFWGGCIWYNMKSLSCVKNQSFAHTYP